MEYDKRQEKISIGKKCKDLAPDHFFPVGSHSGRYKKNLTIRERNSQEGEELKAADFCNGLDDGIVCPVRELCLEFALDTKQDYGVWGGETSISIKRIRRQRRKQTA